MFNENRFMDWKQKYGFYTLFWINWWISIFFSIAKFPPFILSGHTNIYKIIIAFSASKKKKKITMLRVISIV